MITRFLLRVLQHYFASDTPGWCAIRKRVREQEEIRFLRLRDRVYKPVNSVCANMLNAGYRCGCVRKHRKLAHQRQGLGMNTYACFLGDEQIAERCALRFSAEPSGTRVEAAYQRYAAGRKSAATKARLY